VLAILGLVIRDNLAFNRYRGNVKELKPMKKLIIIGCFLLLAESAWANRIDDMIREQQHQQERNQREFDAQAQQNMQRIQDWHNQQQQRMQYEELNDRMRRLEERR
jgi:hypothetical protein